MEPADLNPPKDEDAALAALLRAQQPPLRDDGFSAAVLAALPPAPPKSARWLWVAYAGGGSAGAIYAFSRAGSWPDLVSGLHELGRALALPAAAMADPWLWFGLTVTALSLLSALPFLRPRARFW